MFMHNFKYSLKTLFRNKMLIFWTFAFPIILGTFFNLAFSNIENSERLNIIDLAVVNNDEFNENIVYKKTFENLSDKKNKDRLFNTKYVNEKEAKKLLDDKKIDGYVIINNGKPKVVVLTSGSNETIIKYVTEEISQTEMVIGNLIEYRSSSGENLNEEAFYENIYDTALDMAQENNDGIVNVSRKNLSYTMIEFYTLIAMTCLYGGILGMTAINQNIANMSSKGKRVSVSPMNKGKMIAGSVLAGYVTQIIGVALLFLYTIFVLKVDYGSNLPLIVLLALAGSFAGLTLGIAVAALMKSNEELKTGIIITITMLGCFLSGMMGITMKYIVDKNVPILNKLNPANMITDGLYSLYYYDTYNRYFFNVISLVVFSIIMILISYRALRRQKYDSI